MWKARKEATRKCREPCWSCSISWTALNRRKQSRSSWPRTELISWMRRCFVRVRRRADFAERWCCSGCAADRPASSTATIQLTSCLPRSRSLARISAGRIDRKVEFPAPNETSREQILRIHSRKMNLMRGINLRKIATMLPTASGELQPHGDSVRLTICFSSASCISMPCATADPSSPPTIVSLHHE